MYSDFVFQKERHTKMSFNHFPSYLTKEEWFGYLHISHKLKKKKWKSLHNICIGEYQSGSEEQILLLI